ncbi:MAG: response regulator [Cyclobacteriaceae bacterium]|nr:response regulator [Cyclobacteriaceae bacterium]
MNKKTKKILVADDSPVIQTLTKKIFFGMGYEVTGFKTGGPVIKSIEQNDYDAIILDIILPEVDGITLAKQIRKLKDPVKSKLPIVAISGNYKNHTKEEFESLGIKDLLIKPLDYDQLVAAITRYVE